MNNTLHHGRRQQILRQPGSEPVVVLPVIRVVEDSRRRLPIKLGPPALRIIRRDDQKSLQGAVGYALLASLQRADQPIRNAIYRRAISCGRKDMSLVINPHGCRAVPGIASRLGDRQCADDGREEDDQADKERQANGHQEEFAAKDRRLPLVPRNHPHPASSHAMLLTCSAGTEWPWPRASRTKISSNVGTSASNAVNSAPASRSELSRL